MSHRETPEPHADQTSRLTRITTAPAALADAARQLPGLLRVRALMRRHRDMRELLAVTELPPRARPDPSDARRARIQRGVTVGLRLLGLNRDNCVPRSLALYAALRAEGHPAVFVSGVRRDHDRIIGHAWVELNGQPLPGLGDDDAPARHAENFRHPS